MSNIDFTDTLPVESMRWAARFLSLSWAFWALFCTWFVLSDLTGETLSLAVSTTIMIVVALMFMGAPIIASVWGKEAFGGRVLLLDGVLVIASVVVVAYLTGSPREFFRLPWLNAVVFFTMILPPLVAGSLFLVVAPATASSSAKPKVAGAEAAAEEPDRPEDRTAALLKKITIALLLIGPIVAFAFEVLYHRPKTPPPQALVGRWETEADVRLGRLQVSFNLDKDGTVEGRVGEATMQDAYFKRNRGWLFRMLGWETEYIIVGDLKGSVIGEIQCARFWIVGRFDEEGIRADIDCDGCMKDGKKQGPFGAGSLIYTRVE